MKNKEVIKENRKGNKSGTNDLYTSNEQRNGENKKDDAKEHKSKKEGSKEGKEPRDAKSLRAKFQLRRDKNNALKFEGEGISFKAKMIGIEKVDEARGDKMCQDSLQRLKAAVKLTGEHKQRILLLISLDGIKIKDEKTGEELYHHPVHKISFISQDIGDARAFGYIFGAPHSGHEFFAIKTEKAASNVVIALRDLFQMVLQIKKQEIEKVKQQQENTDSFQTEEKIQVIGSSICDTATGKDSNISQEEPVYSEIISLSEEDRACSPKIGHFLPYSSISSSSREMNTVDSLLDFQFEVDCLQQGIAQMDSSIAAAAAINSSFDMELPFPPLSNPLLAATQADQVASSHQQDISTSELAVGASPSQSIASISDSKDTPVSDNGNISDSIINEASKDSSSNVVEDRYAVFSDLDSIPSIFDNPHIVEIPTSHKEVEGNGDDLIQEQNYEENEDILSNDMPPFPPPVLSRSPKSLNTSIFADLDPLGKNRYVDKKDFFHELKNPPKKVLKDLAGDDLDNDLSFVEFSHSPRSSISDSSAGFVSVCSNNSNPFRSELEGYSPPPPHLPPKQFSVNNDSDCNHDFHENASWDVSSSPSHSPFNPFVSSCVPNFPPPSTPPPPPPPPRLPARGSEPLFQTAPSPPPRPPSRNCATPTPPLPRRKLAQSNHNKLRSYVSVEDSWSNRYSSMSNGDAFSPPLPLPARKPPLPCRTNSPLLGSNSPFSTRRHLTRSPASIDTDSPITSSNFSKNSCLANETNVFPISNELNSSLKVGHQTVNNISLTSSSSSLSRKNNSCETTKQLHAANGASSTFSRLPSPPLPSRSPQRSIQTFITYNNNVSDDSLHASNSSVSPVKNGIIDKQEENISRKEHNDIVSDNKNEIPVGILGDCSIPSIFCRKSDPFDDEFFTTLPKKVSSQRKNQCEIVKATVHDSCDYSSNTEEG